MILFLRKIFFDKLRFGVILFLFGRVIFIFLNYKLFNLKLCFFFFGNGLVLLVNNFI